MLRMILHLYVFVLSKCFEDETSSYNRHLQCVQYQFLTLVILFLISMLLMGIFPYRDSVFLSFSFRRFCVIRDLIYQIHVCNLCVVLTCFETFCNALWSIALNARDKPNKARTAPRPLLRLLRMVVLMRTKALLWSNWKTGWTFLCSESLVICSSSLDFTFFSITYDRQGILDTDL